MKIELTEEDEKIVAAALASGRFETAYEAVHDAILSLALPWAGPSPEEDPAAWQAWAAAGIEQAENGRLTDGPTAMARIRRKLIERHGTNE